MLPSASITASSSPVWAFVAVTRVMSARPRCSWASRAGSVTKLIPRMRLPYASTAFGSGIVISTFA